MITKPMTTSMAEPMAMSLTNILGHDYSDYAFYTNSSFKDLVSGQQMTTTLTTGRPLADDSGTLAGEDIPTISDEKLSTYGAFTQLIMKSEDISDGVWTTGGTVNVTGTDGFQAVGGAASIRQSIATLDSTLYTLSFLASVESGGQTTGYTFYHLYSETGSTTVLILTTIPTMYTVSILGKVAGGNVLFGFRDGNASNWAEVTITDFQVTASTYRLPYLPNDSAVATASSPLNYSDSDEGYKWPIGDTLPDIGSDNWSVTGADLLSGWDLTNWTAYQGALNITTNSFDSDADGSAGVYKSIVVVGKSYELVIDGSLQGSGTFRIQDVALSTIYGIGFGTHTFTAIAAAIYIKTTGSALNDTCAITSMTLREITPSTAWSTCGDNLLDAFDGVADGTTLNSGNLVATTRYVIITTETDHFGAGKVIGDRVTGLTTALDANNTVQTILSAQGEMEVLWTPAFDWDESISSENIVTCNANGGFTGILYHQSFGKIKLNDLTTTIDIDNNYQGGTQYSIKPIWGTHATEGAGKMQIIVTDVSGATGPWESAVVDFDGSFNPGDDFSIGWENNYFQKIDSIKVWPSPQHASWL